MAKKSSSKSKPNQASKAGTSTNASTGSITRILVPVALVALIAVMASLWSAPPHAPRKPAAARRSPGIDPDLPVAEVLARIPTLTDVNYTQLNQDPPIFFFPGFLDDHECELLIDHAKSQGLARSTTTGTMGADGRFHRPTSQSRTSSNAWCFGECFADPNIHKIDERISHIVSRPSSHMEHYQLLHYSVGQEYKIHSDFIYDQSQMEQGAREFTFFLYLSDVEEGGETHFPLLDLTVKPMKGAALLWPNTKYPHHDQGLHLTQHAALPVIKGEKYAANKWIHKGDFLEMWNSGISG